MSVGKFIDLSGNRDIDREILLILSDKDLLSMCSVNHYFYSLCNDNFFYSRLERVYPDTLKYFNKDKYKNYKKFFLNIITYISKLKLEFYYTYVRGNPKKQYEIFTQSPNDQELLWNASREGEIEILQEALKGRSNIASRDNRALRWATEGGHLDIVKYLIGTGININTVHEPLLKIAKQNKDYKILEYLITL